MSRAHVLHLVGSASSPFYHELSVVYARSALLPASMRHSFAVVEPGGGWRVGSSLDTLGAPVDLGRFVSGLDRPDLVVPYMFDPAGMTSFRSFFQDVVGIPVVGSTADVTAMATDKAVTKAIVESAGVRVPRSFTEIPNPADYPVVVKPKREDNSLGLSLVERPEQLEPAVLAAEQYDAGVLIEQYIPGREIRVAVVDLGDDDVRVPAMMEYGVSDAHPMRTRADKLALGDDGNPVSQAASLDAPMICPARLDEALRLELADQAERAHRALGCRDYSLFDFRVDGETGEPYLLEACLFWTFGPISIISRMIEGGGEDAAEWAARVWHNAIARHGTIAVAA